ncbi:hypothetical protein BB8028_0004g01040 [Beauveria bassiana]|uniref:Zn(2)-C6 fungal-type domain-containing protein n=1 Tax=Beauveria bassiana TaxID=176275 RepID=A0A2S7YB50_BEABA|nr:hypothetical protein BB8028_0004g01040 [Beauveria bassiana]
MLKPAVRRSACDQCRAKRVRCLRAQDSMAPCARCCYMSTPCVTSVSRRPGRPPKQTCADVDGTSSSQNTATSPSFSPASYSSPMAREMPHNETLAPTPKRASACSPGRHMSRDALHGIVAPHPGIAKSSVYSHLSKDFLSHESQPGFWAALGDSDPFFGSHSIQQSPTPAQDMIPWLLGPDTQPVCSDYVDETASPALDIDVDPLLDSEEGLLPLARPEQSSTSSAPSSLMGFREDMDRRIAMVDIYYSEPSKVMQRCRDDDLGRDVKNPAAALLTCCKTLVDNIQSLLPPDYLCTKTEDGLDTETLLLIMSCYLAMMRLFDSVFHRIYKHLCQVSPQSYLPSKVKSVIRIGGLSSLQDMPLKTYAVGVLDAIQCQVQTLERLMGIPTEYCLAGEAAPSSTTASGIFSRVDRARLFWIVMTQDDVKSRRGPKSYVQSIRTSMKESLAFLDD